MNHGKLFRVLVMGGAMWAAGCETNDEDGPIAGDDASPPAVDAAPVTADAQAPSSDAGALTECGFCPNEECCVTDDEGSSHTREGMMCCWGTSC